MQDEADYGSEDSGGVNFDKLDTMLEARASKYSAVVVNNADETAKRLKEEAEKERLRVEAEALIKQLEEERI